MPELLPLILYLVEDAHGLQDKVGGILLNQIAIVREKEIASELVHQLREVAWLGVGGYL